MPTSSLRFVKIEAVEFGNGCPRHPTIKNLFGVLLKRFFAGAVLFVCKVYALIERLFLWMVWRATVNPGIVLDLNLCLLAWTCVQWMYFSSRGCCSFPFFWLPVSLAFSVSLCHITDRLFSDRSCTESQTLHLFWFSGLVWIYPTRQSLTEKLLNIIESCLPMSIWICDLFIFLTLTISTSHFPHTFTQDLESMPTILSWDQTTIFQNSFSFSQLKEQACPPAERAIPTPIEAAVMIHPLGLSLVG